MTRYLVFAGADYYPSGGFKDYRGMYYTFDEALHFALSLDEDWYHIVADNRIIYDRGEKVET